MKKGKRQHPSHLGAKPPAAGEELEVILRHGRKLRCVGGIWLPFSGSSGLDRFVEGTHYWRGKVTYQLDSLKAAVALDKRRERVVDVGAHVGLWSRIFSQLYGWVAAVEPLPEHIECLRLNAPADNVEVVEAALGNSDLQAVRFELDVVKGLMNRLATDCTEKPVIMVRQWKLDTLRMGGVSLIKIDVEGAELEVLRGAKETIMRYRPVICIEQKNLGRDYRPGEDQYAARQWLVQSCGYRVAGNVRDDYHLVPKEMR